MVVPHQRPVEMPRFERMELLPAFVAVVLEAAEFPAEVDAALLVASAA